MDILQTLRTETAQIVKQLYDLDLSPAAVTVAPTRKEFTGNFTIVVFTFSKSARKKPEQVAQELGEQLVQRVPYIQQFNIIQGFLNLEMNTDYYTQLLQYAHAQGSAYGKGAPKNERVLVEFSSPNTNKPLHLGHIRNILLGWSVSLLLEEAGFDVKRVQIINDRGIHICKSMLAWQKFGNNETPQSSGMKGDHLVGKYYVLYSNAEREQKKDIVNQGFVNEKGEPTQEAAILQEARQMLLKWEANDPPTRHLWNTMNGWVYDGLNITYQRLGVRFDKNYYESNTYLLGKEYIEQGLQRGIFYQKPDNSVWVDLADAKLDQKLVLRSDGTSVYITQDIGTAQLRYDDWNMNRMIYVVGDEQEYHFKVLFEILKRLEVPYAHKLYHLSYGMVDLPSGRMKSREGTVVDADDLMDEVVQLAQQQAAERGDLSLLPLADQQENWRRIGLGALKYFILKVHPKKGMIFDPNESLDLQGQTGVFLQYACVRTRSLLRKANGTWSAHEANTYQQLHQHEKDLLALIQQYPALIQEAAEQYDPSTVANFAYELAKTYNRLWHDLPMLKTPDTAARAFRLQLSEVVGRILEQSAALLGIEMLDQM